MKILNTQFSLETNSLDIYTAGCIGPHCLGCFNHESWSFDQGVEWNDYYLADLKTQIDLFPVLVKNIMIFGGEPLDNPIGEVILFLSDLKTLNLPIWLFTRVSIDQVPPEVMYFCDYIKCGRFEQDNQSDDNIQFGIKLGSRNQNIYAIREGKYYEAR